MDSIEFDWRLSSVDLMGPIFVRLHLCIYMSDSFDLRFSSSLAVIVFVCCSWGLSMMT